MRELEEEELSEREGERRESLKEREGERWGKEETEGRNRRK